MSEFRSLLQGSEHIGKLKQFFANGTHNVTREQSKAECAWLVFVLGETLAWLACVSLPSTACSTYTKVKLDCVY